VPEATNHSGCHILSRKYFVSQMRNLRFQPAVGSGKSRIASRNAFDCGAKTLGCAREIDRGPLN